MIEDWKVKETENKNKNINTDIDVYIPYEDELDDNSWIMELAKSEEEIEQTGMINFDASISTEKILQKNTMSYLKFLRKSVTKLSSIFNANKSTSSSSIKIYGISNTEADFMVFRNSLKLIFSAIRPGAIQITYNVHTGAFFTENIHASGEKRGDVINATLGPFNETIWTYKGKTVNTKEMLKYFMTKFIQNSSR
jgi:hypothetical protein